MRRGLIVFVCLLLTVFPPAVPRAQQAGKIFRIGFLDPSTSSGSALLSEAFRKEMRKLGWMEGKNFTIEFRFAENEAQERLPELAADLVHFKVDLIVAADTPSALAAKRTTSTIPIVMASVGDPVSAGLVTSLSRPGGNVTGLSNLGYELNTKRLEILKDTIPKLSRVGLLKPAGGSDRQLKELRPAALTLKLKLEEIETERDPKKPRERLSNRKAETSKRHYDDHRYQLLRRKKLDCEACR